MNDDLSESGFDLAQVDRLLTTTRAVRKRLDFTREVTDELLFECIDLAEQAPTGSNDAVRAHAGPMLRAMSGRACSRREDDWMAQVTPKNTS